MIYRNADDNKSTVIDGQLTATNVTERADALRGAQLLIKSLEAEGVEIIFGYPGGANLEIFDALSESSIRLIRTEHKQGAIHAAQGYARASKKVGVCLATSGPGATNLVTGIADANSDSTPIVAICGNVPTHLLGKNSFQEVDIVAITKPITKQNYLLKKVADIPKVVREAFAIAGGNRPGPVLIDIPKDIQQQYPIDNDGNYLPVNIPAMIEPAYTSPEGITQDSLLDAVRLISEAKRPVIYAGGGIVCAGAERELLNLAEKINCPVTTTIMGQGIFPPGHLLALHSIGMHGTKYANTAINEADLVIALGVRFDDRVTGKVDGFIEHGKIIHIDIDKNELNKNKSVTLAICAELKIALKQLVDGVESNSNPKWLDYICQLKESFPLAIPDTPAISPQYAISLLSEMTGGEAIVSLGVGQHQMWAMQFYRSTKTHSFLSSSGFGTMGYGLPAAIGAKVGNPDRMVIDIDGDGSLNMTIHELATCHRYSLGVKIVVINNQWLGMVRQWQDMIYKKNRVGTNLSDPFVVKTDSDLDIYPNFLKIAEGYKVKSERVAEKSQLNAAFKRMLKDPNEPYLLDVIVEAEENVYPMIPAGGTYKDMILCEEDVLQNSFSNQGSNI